MMPMRVVSGKSRPMRDGFPIGTSRHRSFEEAHSLLGQRVCAVRDKCFHKTLSYPLKQSFGHHLF
jgi:hypothetical protein